ncbi:MAG: PEP-CTERM sorting domain-containing protein [Armatimonadetes bacterium]|nr:PEP-CTERM sorting domain-containing protein [Armatimonadota bacterium]
MAHVRARFLKSSLFVGILGATALADASVQTTELAWPPADSDFVQTNSVTTNADGKVKVDDIKITKPIDKPTPLTEEPQTISFVNSLEALVTFGDGSVRKVDGSVKGAFSTMYLGLEGQARSWNIEAAFDSIDINDNDVAMRYRPGNHKPGKFTFTRLDQRETIYNVDGFFDVFFDISVDGGKTFQELTDPVEFGISPAVTPEPASMAALGLAAATLIRRRRQSR